MKSPLAKLRSIALNKGESKVKWDHNFSMPIDGLMQAAKDMKEMRTCYDGLLSAAAATANSAYEFSESLLEMGNSLLEKTTMHDDEDSRGALSMLGKVQLELQKLVDSYRSHIIMTITNPSECLLSELRKVEEMKLQCDEKREMFEYMVDQVKEKSKFRHGKGETFSMHELRVVCDEYDEAARLCVFRVESLKQGQSRSLFTQAARHHAAQLNFFRKGLQSLEAVEPYIKYVAETQHIDYELSEINKGERDDGGNSFESSDYRELSFDYRHKEQEPDNTSTLRNSMGLDQLGTPSAPTSLVKDVELQRSGSKSHRASSHSAPIYVEKFDIADRVREFRPTIPKLTAYVLPTPVNANSSNTTSGPLSSPKMPAGSSKNLWHSSPLDTENPIFIADDQLSTRNYSKSQVAVEESSSYKHSLPLPPLTEGAALSRADTQSGFDAYKFKRQAFSGPITSKPSLNMSYTPTLSNDVPQLVSGLLSGASVSQAPLLVNVSHNASPALATSPKISELHELPRPPDTFNTKPVGSIGTLGHSAPLVNRKSIGSLGHSAPLVNRNWEVSPTSRNPFRQSGEGSPLPLPQLTVSHSFSIPCSGQREVAFHSGKLLGSSQILESVDGVASPPLSPLSLLHMNSPNSGQIRVNAGGS